MKRAICVLALAGVVGSCQTYDFERVTPLAVSQTSHPQEIKAKSLKPNIMLLVDTSGSMDFPSNPAEPTCGDCEGDSCPATCPTRMQEMKGAMAAFLSSSSATVARYGLATYPDADSSDVCRPTSGIRVGLPAQSPDDVGHEDELAANATAVNEKIQEQSSSGGTPTAASLFITSNEVGLRFTPAPQSSGADDFRDDFILLLTDGLPNCNLENKKGLGEGGADCWSSMQPIGNCNEEALAACNCTQPAVPPLNVCATVGYFSNQGCLDTDQTVEVINNIRTQKKIRTIVVGFGADLVGGVAPQVLNEMAIAGGFPRNCKRRADACGAETCDTSTADKLCPTKFYAAADRDALSAALDDIINNLENNPCEQTLANAPSDPRFLSVIIDGETLKRDEHYTYDDDREVIILGEHCSRLLNSSPREPVKIDLRVVQKL